LKVSAVREGNIGSCSGYSQLNVGRPISVFHASVLGRLQNALCQRAILGYLVSTSI